MLQKKPLSLVYGEYGENTGFRTRIEMIKRLLDNTLGTKGDWLTFERGINRKSVQWERTSRIIRLPRTRSLGSLAGNYFAARRGKVTAELDSKYDFVVAHSFNSIFIANAFKKQFKAPVLLDIHGLWLEEMLSRHSTNSVLRKMALKKIEKIMLESADGLIYASNPLKNALVDRYPKLTQKPSMVIPCLPDLEQFTFDSKTRKSLRVNWGWENCTVVVHSGINAPWVDVAGIRHLLKTAGCIPEVRFLFLASDPAQWEGVFDGVIDRSKAKIISLEHKDMPATLSAADVGLVARIDCPINRVASPTKIAEYLAVGLPVLMTAGIGDYDNWVRQFSLGFCLPGLTDISLELLRNIFSTLHQLDREHISRWARTKLSLDATYNEFCKIYEQLTGNRV